MDSIQRTSQTIPTFPIPMTAPKGIPRQSLTPQPRLTVVAVQIIAKKDILIIDRFAYYVGRGAAQAVNLFYGVDDC